MKVAEVAPAANVTEAGTVRVLLVVDKATAAPPVGAGPVNVTVHVELLEALRAVGTHARDVTVGRAPPVTSPPVADRGMFRPSADAAKLSIAIAVVTTPTASVRFTVATVPLAIVPPFIPYATQVYPRRTGAQLNDLLAAVSAGPAFTEIESRLARG